LCLAALDEETEADAWLDFMERALGETSVCERAWVPDLHPIVFTLSRPRARYLEDIARCKRHIRDGDTYEVCLTNRIHTAPVPDPLGVYLALRRINPAPHAAYLDFGEVVVMSSSPERFLAIDRERWIESKPIKGTRPRGRTDDEDRALREQLGEDEKDRSENLMIVDLVRNDLGAVCEVGTVHVPALMQVESYETVHHLVSTIRGRLRPGLGAIDAIVSAFPGGSMTGAPKLRTMDIIDGLEDEPRGVYAGALGFLGLGGTADLSIVIRTVVQTPTSTTIGMGGAVVSLSDPETEFEETMVKARPLVHAIVLASHGTVAPAALDAGMQQLRETGATRF
jgi:para-aminobenzoate synthetase